jgi:hypothetical protein
MGHMSLTILPEHVDSVKAVVAATNNTNLLRGREYVTLAVQLGDPTEFELVARCPTP